MSVCVLLAGTTGVVVYLVTWGVPSMTLPSLDVPSSDPAGCWQAGRSPDPHSSAVVPPILPGG